MKIKVGTLVDFLKRVVLTGNSTINSGILEFREGGVEFIALSNDTSVLSYGLLDAKAFSEYETLGKLAFQSLPNVVKLLDNFGGSQVRLLKKENTLVIKSKSRTVSLMLMDSSFVDRPKELPQSQYKTVVKVDTEKMKTFFKDYSAIGATRVGVTMVDGSLELSCVNNDEVKMLISIEGKFSASELKVSFGPSLLDTISGLSGELKLGLQSNFPMKIQNKDGFIDCLFYVAPSTEERKSSKEK